MESIEGINQIDSENDQFLSSLEVLRQRIQSQEETLTSSLDREPGNLQSLNQLTETLKGIPLHVVYKREYTQGLAAYSPALNAIIVGDEAVRSSEEAIVAALRHETVHGLFANLSADDQATLVDGFLKMEQPIITVALALDYFGYRHNELNSPIVGPELRGKKIERPITYRTAKGETKTADATDVVNELLAYALMGEIEHVFPPTNSERGLIVENFFNLIRSIVKKADPDVQRLLEAKGFNSLDVTELLQELRKDVASSENTRKINPITQYYQQKK